MLSGTETGNEQLTTEIHYPAGAAGAAQQVAAAFGVGELVEDDADHSGHIMVVVGTDLDYLGIGPRGRNDRLPTQAPAAEPPAAAEAPAAEPITAASHGAMRQLKPASR